MSSKKHNGQNESMLQHVARLPRSGFDLGQSFAFTASTGMILPVYTDLLNVGETVSLSTDFFARTQPLVTAAMADVDVYLDWFFVPATMLYTPFGQIRWQTNDFVSSWFDPALLGRAGGFPLLDMSSYEIMSLSSWSNPSIFSTTKFGSGATSIYYSPDFFDVEGKSYFRMLDCLGFNPCGVFNSQVNPNVFPIFALAYQAIYMNHFRNDDYELRLVSSYNWDKYWQQSAPVSVKLSGSLTAENPFVLRYADYRKDYFTSIKPSPIMSSLNLLQGLDTSKVLARINNFLNTVTSAVPSQIDTVFAPSSDLLFSQFYEGDSSGSYSSETSTAGLRSLFAVEKLQRIVGRSAKDYDSQVLAHFGFKVPHDVKHDITHLHQAHGMLHIGEVINTADTYNGSTGSALGEIAGKGYISIHDGKRVKFTAPVDGVLMCTFHCLPRLRVVNAFNKQNALATRLDLYNPEFDKLGMQPLFDYEWNATKTGSFIGIGHRGWQFRYNQYKRKYDRASYVFSQDSEAVGSINQYKSWVLTYTPFSETHASGASNMALDLKCPPTALNNIMVVPYIPSIDSFSSFSVNPASAFLTDPLICDFRANVKKVSTMSPTGEPNMISL